MFQKNKAVIKQQALEDDKLKKKFSIDVSLLEENDEDKMTASRIRFHKRDGKMFIHTIINILCNT